MLAEPLRKKTMNMKTALWHPLFVGFGCWAVSLLLAAPNLRDYFGPDAGNPSEQGNRFHDIFSLQVENPFFRPAQPMPSWAGAMACRILVPGFCHVCGIGPWGGVGLTWLAGALLLATVYRIAITHGISTTNSLLFTLSLSCTPCVQGVHIYVGFVDTVSWLSAAAMILWPAPLAWTALTTLALFNDERILVSLPLALAVVLFGHRHTPFVFARQSVRYIFAISVALALSLAGRFAIKTGWVGNAPLNSSELPMDGGVYPFATWHVLNLLCSYGPLWALVLWALVRDRRAWIFWLGVLAYTAVAAKTCTFTFDFWRSLGSLFPLFIIALLAIRDAPPQDLTRSLATIALFSLVRPQVYFATGLKWLRPLPIALAELAYGDSLLRLLRLR
jgi:hypothetical protein